MNLSVYSQTIQCIHDEVTKLDDSSHLRSSEDQYIVAEKLR